MAYFANFLHIIPEKLGPSNLTPDYQLKKKNEAIVTMIEKWLFSRPGLCLLRFLSNSQYMLSSQFLLK